MKITDPDVIKTGEKDLIDAVKDDLDLDVVKQILKKKIATAALSAKGGQILVHNNEIAFRVDFDLNLSGSLMFDRDGNYISDDDEDQAPDKLDSGDFDSDETDSDEDDLNKLIDEDNSSPIENIDLDDDLKIELPDYGLDDNDTLEDDILEDDLLDDDTQVDNASPGDMKDDDDIEDIFKESQDFWENKKD